MAGAKEIRSKIKSIQNTQKITKAMEMVAASKMRRAQDRMLSSRPYAARMRNVIAHLAQAHPEYHHRYLVESDVSRVGLVVISTDRGLCGGLNINLFKSVARHMKKFKSEGHEIDLCTIGQKGSMFFKRLGGNVVAHVGHLGDAPLLQDLIGTVRVMLNAYDENKIDHLYLAYNQFVNSMTQTPMLDQLLPIPKRKKDERLTHHWDYLYEPESKEVMNALLMRYVESLVYQGMVENIACEQAARMVAMKSASDNAGDIIDELQLVYNKARQAAITQEISEIVGGAAAV